MQIRLIFDTGYELTVDLFDNDFVNRWYRLLSQEIACGSLLQEDTYSNFIPESLARQRLEEAIDSVNGCLKREFISTPCVSDYDNPDFYNQLHEKFEQLAGPDWSQPTRLMLLAPDNVKLAIRHINRYCHRLERRPYVELSSMRVEFNTHQRESLTLDDYKLFQPVTEPNIVVLDYSTLGKSLHECYEDSLNVDYHGMKIQHHYCANFILQFNQPQNDHARFKKWCAEQGITEIPASELGHIQLGKIYNQESFDQVKKTAKILDIILE
jgi:hypothetical protein